MRQQRSILPKMSEDRKRMSRLPEAAGLGERCSKPWEDDGVDLR